MTITLTEDNKTDNSHLKTRRAFTDSSALLAAILIWLATL